MVCTSLVAIVLTVYGIETASLTMLFIVSPYVAIVLTVYGIETKFQKLYVP